MIPVSRLAVALDRTTLVRVFFSFDIIHSKKGEIWESIPLALFNFFSASARKTIDYYLKFQSHIITLPEPPALKVAAEAGRRQETPRLRYGGKPKA